MTEQIPVTQKSDKEIMDSVNKSYSGFAQKYVEKKEKGNAQSLSCCEPAEETVTTADACYEPAEVTEQSPLVELVQPNTIPTLGCDQGVKGGLLTIAKPQEGETVVDLGSGPGRDSINAAKLVGGTGRVIGIDFSDDMLTLARDHAFEQKIHNVDYRKGNLLELPVDDNTVDLIISNCVINLVPDKVQVFREAHRILKPGGRIVESDMVGLISKEEEAELMNLIDETQYCGCVGGAVSEESYVQQMKEAGFTTVEVQRLSEYKMKIAGKEIPYASSAFIAYKE
ncbi:MAG: methyltransferase domain-containing protein [Candidatus Kariarchaeaceae archaeon]|jgi:SAM-dependent methyltransferase